MKTYVQLTKEEQDEFVVTLMEETIFEFKDLEELQTFQDIMNNDPEVRQAGIDWGRSACARFIVHSKNIFSGLSLEDKTAYYAEEEEYQQRYDRFKALINQNPGIYLED